MSEGRRVHRGAPRVVSRRVSGSRGEGRIFRAAVSGRGETAIAFNSWGDFLDTPAAPLARAPDDPMLTDLSFDDNERSGAKRGLLRLVVTCLLASSIASFAVARELKIRDEFRGIPQALSGDLDSLQERHDAILEVLERHHVWVGALGARRELDQLVLSIHQQERVEGDQARRRAAEVNRAREEAEAARVRGFLHAERHQFDLALDQFRRALELSDAVGEQAWSGGIWEHREQLLVDISALETRAEGKR